MTEDDLIGIFPRDSTWGHRITFDSYKEQRVYGWITPHVSNGDKFGFEMESGKTAVFRLKAVDNKDDPKDMFIANTEPVGYLDEL